MSSPKSYLRFAILLWGLIFSFGIAAAIAQEEEDPNKKYREDYEKFQKIIAIGDPMKKADSLMTFLGQGPDPKLVDYVQGNFLQVVENLAKTEKNQNVITLCERFIKMRPKVGETYYFYGVALKNTQRFPESLDAFAKCYVLKNKASNRAKDFLDFVYKSQHQGNLAGEEKIIKKAQEEAGK